MPNLSVPERYRSGIADIGKLSAEAFDQFFEALKKTPEFNDSRNWLHGLAPKCLPYLSECATQSCDLLPP